MTFRILAAMMLIVLLRSGSLGAQTLYGSMVGTVTDESGLAIPGATVVITHLETSQKRESTTGQNGGYNFTNIPTGTYDVEITMSGFQSAKSKGVVVQQNNGVRIDAKLSIGALQETVLVSGTAAILQTESAAVQQVTTSQQIENLPTSGRSYQSFMALMPGVAQPYMVQAGGINNPARSMGVSVNGQPPANTVFRVDGAMVTNQWYGDLQSYSPGLEAVETVSVVTNSFDADQGMAGGAAVNVQVKSGTNTLAGSAFEYLTDSRLKNRPYFLPAGTPKGADQKHVSGATLGGPIVRNKLFYFASVETEFRRVRQGTVQLAEGETSTGTTGLNTLPPADLRTGDFSRTNTVIYDPATGSANGTGRVPFAFANCGLTSTSDPRFASCNYIPANRINPISKALLDKLILPTTNNFQDNYYARDNFESDLIKLDTKTTWTPNTKININSRLSWLGSKQHSHGIFPSVDGAQYNPLSVGRQWKANITSGSLLATAILSPQLVADGTFGYTPYHSWVEPEGPKECWGAAFNIPNACQPPYSRDRAAPGFNMGGWSLVTPSQMRDYGDNQIQWTGNLGWTKSSHNFKTGFDITHMYVNHYETAVPTFTFNGAETALNGGASPNNFNQFADFLLGLPFSRTAQAMMPLLSLDGAKSADLPATARSWAYGLYVRDQWQVNHKMTASVGVRWEYYPFPTRSDSGFEIFDFTTNRIQICGLPGANAQVCDIQTQKDLFTPRLGLAYRPTENTVLRVGFSRNPQNDNAVTRNGGLTQTFPKLVSISQSGPNTFTPVGNLSDGVPIVPLLDRSTGTVSVPAGAGLTTVDHKFVRGSITSYNITLQHVLPHSISVQVGYVANRQRNLIRTQNLNYGQIGGGAASQPFNQNGLPDGMKTTSAINVFRPLGRVDYDSLQLSVTRRLMNGFQVTSAYTYAKSTDWWADSIPIPDYWYLNKGPQGGATRAGASVPHKVDASLVYQLPFGAGKHFLSNGGVLGVVFGGWQLSSGFTAYSGSAFSITSSSASLNAPGSTQRADQVKDNVEILGGVGPTTPYFDVLAFKPVTEARFGTAAVNNLRGPGVRNVDLSFTRTMAAGSHRNLQLKVEIFNLFNRPTFAIPSNLNVSNLQLNADGTVQNLNGFGVINTTQNAGREYSERYVRIGIHTSF